VWEPFFFIYKNELVLYYSDQRDPAHSQKLAHQVTTDLKTWGPVVDDVAYPEYHYRPGMTTVAKLPNGQYILTYEFYGAPEDSFAVYYKLATDPTKFNASPGYVIKTTDGNVLNSSPYVTWTPAGGRNGTIVVSSGCCSSVFTNTALAAPGSAWTEVPTPDGIDYSPSLTIMPDVRNLLIVGGGAYEGTNNTVRATVIRVAK
jgi:hypothetical protein